MTDSILRSYQFNTTTTMVPFSVAAPALLDTYSGASFAYSFRKLRTAYTGSAVRIRRSSDNAEADIGFSGSDFDAAAAAAHIGGGSGFVVTWYDQSGNGVDVTQATAGNQPTYRASTVLSKPSAEFAAGGTIDRASKVGSTLFGSNGHVTLFLVVKNNTDVGSQQELFWSDGSTPFQIAVPFGGVSYFDNGSFGAGGRVNYSPVSFSSVPHLMEYYRDNSDTQAIFDNGASQVSATRTDDVGGGSAALQIGVGGGSGFLGHLLEIVLWPSYLGDTERAAARTAINAYYSVF